MSAPIRGIAIEATARTGCKVIPVVVACEDRFTIANPAGLDTRRLIAAIDRASDTGGDLVTYGIDYFASLLAHECDLDALRGLWAGEVVEMGGGWAARYIPSLQLWLWHEGRKRSIRIVDVQRWGGETLAATCRLFGVPLPPAGKRWQLTSAAAQATAEAAAATFGAIGRALVDALGRAGLPRHWREGTGRVAGAILDKLAGREVLQANPHMIDGVMEMAYFGGRVSIARVGLFDHVTQLDIRSAYASAMTTLPNLAGAVWRKATRYDPHKTPACWHVHWSLPKGAKIGPLPVRIRNRITYPLAGSGYYWHEETAAALKYFPDHVTVSDGAYICLQSDDKPFAGIASHYARRQALRDDGDDAAAHVLKIALTACYGRLAQVKRHDGTPGRWASLALAGMTTSHIRARMLGLFMDHYERAIAIATDSLTVEGGTMHLAGAGLGQFKIEYGQDAILLPSGAYHARKGAETMDRVAGVARAASETIFWDFVREQWGARGPATRFAITVPVFVGVGLAANGQIAKFGTWRKKDHDIVGAVHDGSLRREGGNPRDWRVWPSAGGRASDRYIPKAGSVSRRPDQGLVGALTALEEQGTPAY